MHKSTLGPGSTNCDLFSLLLHSWHPLFFPSRGRTKTHCAACRFWPVNNCPDRVYSVLGGGRQAGRGVGAIRSSCREITDAYHVCVRVVAVACGGGEKGARMWGVGAPGTIGSDNERPQSWSDLEKRGAVMKWGGKSRCARVRVHAFSSKERRGANVGSSRARRRPFNGSFSRTFQVEATANKWLKVQAKHVSSLSPGPPSERHRQVPRVGTRQSC